MSTEEFINRCEYLYHLTSEQNLANIISMRRLLSSKEIIANSDLSRNEQRKVLTERRPDHFPIQLNGIECLLRDQRPISIKALQKCLTDDWSVADFIESLNSRVFFWPTLKRLVVHFNRYKTEEHPKIIKVRTRELLEINSNALRFCHLNSGATRCHPKWNGSPPPRGLNTFVRAANFNYLPVQVAEVTFLTSCNLPNQIFVGNNPEGPWRSVALDN